MITASLEKEGKKLAYRCFTNKANSTVVYIERKLKNTDAKIVVYKSLYGDMDENFMLPDVTLYPSLSEFRDAIKKMIFDDAIADWSYQEIKKGKQ